MEKLMRRSAGDPAGLVCGHFAASAASIASVTSGESGLVRGSKRLMIFPSRPIRNLLKFHLMSPGYGDSGPASATYRGWRFGPLTSILSNSGKLTLYFDEQNCLISSFVPGSCPPNWLQGKPRTVKPLSLYFSCKVSNAWYWGVRPHFEATFTIKITFPL